MSILAKFEIYFDNSFLYVFMYFDKRFVYTHHCRRTNLHLERIARFYCFAQAYYICVNK